MENLTILHTNINKLIEANSIDERRRFGDMILGWYKSESNLVQVPIAIKLNAQLELKESIDNYLIHDNEVSREKLMAIILKVSSLLKQPEAA